MPSAILKNVVYVSSEDQKYPASNLLQNVGKKWKSKECGDPSIYVVIELEKPSTIKGIDIGNEHSAFIGVFVKKKGADDKDFKEILLASSFMTPLESRNSETTHRVRCFSEEALVEGVADEKWDIIKVVCTQTFNKHVQYGLSFIKVHIVEETKSELKKSKIAIGKIKFREDSPDSPESGSPSSSLFSRWKQSKESDIKKTTASEIRAASSLKQIKNPITTKCITNNNTSFDIGDDDSDNNSKKNRVRNYDKMLYDDEDEKPNQKYDKKIEADKLRTERKSENLKKLSSEKTKEIKHKKFETNEPSTSTKNTERKNKRTLSPDNKTPENKRRRNSLQTGMDSNETKTPKLKPSNKENAHTSSENISTTVNSSKGNLTVQSREQKSPTPERLKIYKCFSKMMEGVVLVISGIQNPERGELRKKALDMGAKYKSDWDNTTTHLICAFKNTPKYNQVHGKGKIISKFWILDSHLKRVRLPWRRYALDSNDKAQSESEDEIYDEKFKPIDAEKHKNEEKSITEKSENFKNVVENDDDVMLLYDQNNSPECITDEDGEDTEDEIERIKNDEKINESKKSEISIFDKSTDDEETGTEKSNHNMEFFKHCKFYLNEHLQTVDLIKLKTFIKQYRGEIIANPNEANFIISNEKMTKLKNFNGEILKPLWVFECNDMECLLPTRRYKIE